jgi:hypothetical protein
MFVDFFGDELKVGQWVLTPGYKGQDLKLLQIRRITAHKVLLDNEHGYTWGGVMKTSKLVIAPEDKVILRRLSM